MAPVSTLLVLSRVVPVLRLTLNRSFIGQGPVFLVAIILCWTSLPNNKPRQGHPDHDVRSNNLGRVDFLGSALLAAFLVFLLLPLELGGSKIAWNDPQILVFVSMAALFLILFVGVEKWWSANPLLPLDMFCNRHTVTAFVIMALLCAAQLGVRPIPHACDFHVY